MTSTYNLKKPPNQLSINFYPGWPDLRVIQYFQNSMNPRHHLHIQLELLDHSQNHHRTFTSEEKKENKKTGF